MPHVDEHVEYWRFQFPQPESFVYVIRATSDSPIKIGIASDVASRLAQLQTGNPRRLRLLHLLVGGNDLEWQLHRRLKGYRLVGEWFDGEPISAFLEFVADLADRMLASHERTKELPDFRDFGEWEGRKKRPLPAPVITHFVAPQPLSPEEIKQRDYERESKRIAWPLSR